MGKTLIAYYSRDGYNYVGGDIVNLTIGNTEAAAEMIRKLTGFDIFCIKQLNKYSSDYNKCTEEAKADQEANARPKLESYPESISEYDTVILAYPNYWGTMPMVVFTFLEMFDFSGKTVLPLCTHEGSGIGRSEADIKKLCPTATVKPGHAIKGCEVKNSQSQIKKWFLDNI